jgi:hypothetical protein
VRAGLAEGRVYDNPPDPPVEGAFAAKGGLSTHGADEGVLDGVAGEFAVARNGRGRASKLGHCER